MSHCYVPVKSRGWGKFRIKSKQGKKQRRKADVQNIWDIIYHKKKKTKLSNKNKLLRRLSQTWKTTMSMLFKVQANWKQNNLSPSHKGVTLWYHTWSHAWVKKYTCALQLSGEDEGVLSSRRLIYTTVSRIHSKSIHAPKSRKCCMLKKILIYKTGKRVSTDLPHILPSTRPHSIYGQCDH